MGVVSTKEVFDAYFAAEEAKGLDVRRVRGQVDRKEVYAYEEKLGKQIFDMSPTELLDMVRTFDTEEYGDEHFLSAQSWQTLSMRFRAVFYFYLTHYKIIINPWDDPVMKGKVALNYLMEGTKPYTYEDVERVIGLFRKDYLPQRSDYLECIIRLFHEGVYDADEIVGMKNSDVDVRTGKIKLPGRQITITPRTVDLIYTVHIMNMFGDGKSVMAPWKDSYFRFPVRKMWMDKIDERPKEVISATVSRTLAKFVAQRYNFKINSRVLYLLGLYEFIVARFGQEETDRMILSSSGKNDEASDNIFFCAREYGMQNIPSVTKVKQFLIPYVHDRSGFII
jgi:integrase